MTGEGPTDDGAVSRHVVVIGGGLAGLSCAYELVKAGARVTVLEREPRIGGMADSFEEGDRAEAGEAGSEYWCYDYGPHRFHTDDPELIQHVKEILGPNVTTTRRLSRILMKGKFYKYPIEIGNVLRNMSPWLIAAVALDYAWTRICDLTKLRRYTDANFVEWTERRFGKILSKMFFIEYTEKAWGMPASQISSDWASQRITLLNLRDTVVKALPHKGDKGAPRTLVTKFVYPLVGGIGELARGYRTRIEEMGGTVLTDAVAVKVHRVDMRVVGVEYRLRGNEREHVTGDDYVSTIPLTAMAKAVDPPAPPAVLDATRSLEYVAIVLVYLKLAKPQVSPDNWVYLPERHLTIHRISEFKNFSSKCAPAGETLVCAEITCRVGDRVWKADQAELREIAVRDLVSVGLIEASDVLDSFSKRVPYAYPVYDLGYGEHLRTIMDFVHGLENIQTGGRQGLFRYNNMDQSIEMGRRMGLSLATGVDLDHESVATAHVLFEYGPTIEDTPVDEV